MAFQSSMYNYGKTAVGCIDFAQPIDLPILKPGRGGGVLERITPKCYNLVRCTEHWLPGMGH